MGWYSVATIALAVAPWVWLARPSSTVPIDGPVETTRVTQLAFVTLVLVMVGAVASAAALGVRYRRSSGATRLQIRWIAWGGTFLVATLVLGSVISGTLTEEGGSVSSYVALVGEALLILSFAVAITRYRLYDIDAVISKTVTYGALAIFITAVYVAIVVGIGTLVGRGDEPNLALAIGATAAVALLFEPIRFRLQRWANRLVYGERATPYEVLARFSKRAATVQGDDEMLERIPRLVVDGTGASRATLWTASSDELRPTARWPDQTHSAAAISVGADRKWTDPEADYSLPIEHYGELLGGLSLVASRGESITPIEEELVHNLAGGLGLAPRNARLTDDLRDQ